MLYPPRHFPTFHLSTPSIPSAKTIPSHPGDALIVLEGVLGLVVIPSADVQTAAGALGHFLGSGTPKSWLVDFMENAMKMDDVEGLALFHKKKGKMMRRMEDRPAR